jgi:spore maturation protein CgeB
MKLLFVSNHNPHHLTITEYIERAIRDEGHELSIYDDRKHIIPGRIRYHLSWLHELDRKDINRRLMKVAKRVRPEIILAAWGTRILPNTLIKLKNLGIRTVLWTVDAVESTGDFYSIIKAAPFYDYIFCGGTEAQEVLGNEGINKTYWLPFACDTGYHRKVKVTTKEKANYGSDVVFVGSYYPNRWEVFRELKEFDLTIWGSNWYKAEGVERSGIKIRNLYLQPWQWVKIINSSKIAVVAHYQGNKYPCYQASPKVYEWLACGSFLLVDRQRDVFKLFKDGEHLVGFNNANDLKEKIRYYLKYDDLREKIAVQGRKEVLRKHTFAHRIREMLTIVAS